MCVWVCVSEERAACARTACPGGIPVLSSTRPHSGRRRISSMTAGIPLCVCSCICVTLLPPPQQPGPPGLKSLVMTHRRPTFSSSSSSSSPTPSPSISCILPLLLFCPFICSSSSFPPLLCPSVSFPLPRPISFILSSASHPGLSASPLIFLLSSPPIPLFSISSFPPPLLSFSSPPLNLNHLFSSIYSHLIPFCLLCSLQLFPFIASFCFPFSDLPLVPSSSTFTPRSLPAIPHLLPPVSSICFLFISCSSSSILHLLGPG